MCVCVCVCAVIRVYCGLVGRESNLVGDTVNYSNFGILYFGINWVLPYLCHSILRLLC